MGEPIEIGSNSNIHASASVLCFCAPPLDPLNTVTGIVTIRRFSGNFIDGSMILSFSDPEEVNTVVDDSIRFWIRFSKIACQELELKRHQKR